MVTGHTGAGKTNFIATLLETLNIQKLHWDESDFPPTFTEPAISRANIECKPGKESIMLRLIDTPGLGIPNEIHRAPPGSEKALERAAFHWLGNILNYVESQFAQTLGEEMKVKRVMGLIDTHVHCVLYFLRPDLILANNGITTMDKIALQGLSRRENVIPCLGKSDLVTRLD